MTTFGARLWPWVPALLLGAMLTGLGTMAVIATQDPGFALEKNYYAKAVAYDREMAQRAANARLGWMLEVELGPAGPGSSELVVRVRDARGPISGARGRVEALRNASAANVLFADFVERGKGEYLTSLPVRRGGLWELRLAFERGGERFTAAPRVDVLEVER